MTKKYNHAFDVAFEIDSDNEGENVTEEELFAGLRRRVSDLERDFSEGGHEILEACGLPFDTYENEEGPDVRNSL